MKYIVYLTTNIKNSKIYVGVHSTENPNKFDGYLGNGVNRNNPSSIKTGTQPFVCAVRKYGFDSFRRSTLYIFDSMEEALNMESLIVDEEFIKREDTYNITLGGGLPPKSDKKTYQYDLEGNFIKEWNSRSEAAREYSNSDLIFGCSTIYNAITFHRKAYGYLWSDNKVDKLDVQYYNNKVQNTITYLYDLEGNYLNSFDSITKCSEYLNISFEQVRRALILKHSLLNQYQVSTELFSILPKQSPVSIKGDIHRYDLDGNYLDSFKSLSEIKNKLGITLYHLDETLESSGYQKGFQWRRGVKLSKIEPYKVISKRKIGQYTMDDKLVKIFNTVKEARKEFPNVSKVLSGIANHCHNFKFKYID